MCGIACLIANDGGYSRADVERMTDAVAHRGPDGRGLNGFRGDDALSETQCDDFLVALGHRRLSILDLSEAGAQPMSSNDGTLVVSYNGEIYNYLELRDELESLGAEFHSNCDTEVLLAAYRQWGTDCLKRFNGMWAFALLDRRRRTLFISRDRIGIKPLYHWRDGDRLAVASEIKQFQTLPGFKATPNRDSCVTYLVSGYERAPETFFDGVAAFPPGHYAEINLDRPDVQPKRFWFPDDISAADDDGNESVAEIRRRFSRAVELRLRSDVPVGGCLSGGLDSSSIFVAMRDLAPDQPFTAFSACFDVPAIDERPFMTSVTEKTGCRHVQVFPDQDELTKRFDALLACHDEPIGSVSMFAQYKVMEAARKDGVPVLLDGQGGDELFSGYWPAYMLFLNHLKNIGDWGGLSGHLLGAAMPGGNGDLLRNAFSLLSEYRRRSQRQLPFTLKREIVDQTSLPDWHQRAKGLTPEEYRKAEILSVHLPRLLKWEDRNSMAFSIESRVPFLDVDLVELLLSVPVAKNLRRGWNKRLFRQAMAGSLPDDICWRKDKMGFETPQSLWTRSGAFHDRLVKWSEDSDRPVDDYVEIDADALRRHTDAGRLTTEIFRVFCLDQWLRGMSRISLSRRHPFISSSSRSK